jgi:hypothetical protein
MEAIKNIKRQEICHLCFGKGQTLDKQTQIKRRKEKNVGRFFYFVVCFRVLPLQPFNSLVPKIPSDELLQVILREKYSCKYSQMEEIFLRITWNSSSN